MVPDSLTDEERARAATEAVEQVQRTLDRLERERRESSR